MIDTDRSGRVDFSYHITENLACKKTNIIGHRNMVYICMAETGDRERNSKNAEKYTRFVIGRGYYGMESHLLYPEAFSGRIIADYRMGILLGMTLMRYCSEIWVFADSKADITYGMMELIDVAKREEMRIQYYTTDTVKWSGEEGCYAQKQKKCRREGLSCACGRDCEAGV